MLNSKTARDRVEIFENEAAGLPQNINNAEPTIEPKKKILFVASEARPFIATGGLADVIGSLPQALVRQDRFQKLASVPHRPT